MGYRNFFISLLVGTALYAFRVGGKPEKWTAGLLVGAGALTLAVHSPWPARYVGLEIPVLLVDLALLLCLLTIALHADRFWPLLMASFQAMAVAAHVAKALDLRLGAGAYQQALIIWSYVTLPLLAFAVWRHHRRIVLGVEVRDWSSHRARNQRRSSIDDRKG